MKILIYGKTGVTAVKHFIRNLDRQNLHFSDPDQRGQMNAAFMQIRSAFCQKKEH